MAIEHTEDHILGTWQMLLKRANKFFSPTFTTKWGYICIEKSFSSQILILTSVLYFPPKKMLAKLVGDWLANMSLDGKAEIF